MDTTFIKFSILLLLAGIFYTATTSIGIQCSNDSPEYKQQSPNNVRFLISQLVCAILITIMGLVGIYLGSTGNSLYTRIKLAIS